MQATGGRPASPRGARSLAAQRTPNSTARLFRSLAANSVRRLAADLCN